MIIKADNRGRLALGKAAEGSIYGMSHTEWDVTYSSGTFTVKKVTEEPKSEWQKWGRLDPNLIGQTIYIDADSLEDGSLPQVRDYVPAGIVGVLEWYKTGALGSDVVEVKLQGAKSIKFSNYGLFWVKA